MPSRGRLRSTGASTETSTAAASAGIDTLDARLADTYRRRDPGAYAALYTNTAVVEWPAFHTVRGTAALAAMARDNWAAERDVALRLRVATRRLAADHATEFGRYVSLLVRPRDGSWRLDRFFGFENSTRSARPQP